MLMRHEIKKADCIIVLGSHDLRVAERGAQLFLDGYAPLLVFSGNRGNLTNRTFERPEAEIFAEIAIQMGVPPEKIVKEPNATNTGENIIFSRQLLKEKGIEPARIVLVQKPYMERRTYATCKKQWPEPEIIVTSPQIPYDKYFNEHYPKELIINVMVGDLQRIKLYPEKGFQVYQEIPKDVWQAYEELVAMGYTRHLMHE